MRFASVVLVCAALFVPSVVAQSPNGTVNGQVLDPSGEVIADCRNCDSERRYRPAVHHENVQQSTIAFETLNRDSALGEGARLSRLPSSRFLGSVHVLIALSLGKYGTIDRSANPKGKLQLTVF
jgi:hypothetical protein